MSTCRAISARDRQNSSTYWCARTARIGDTSLQQLPVCNCSGIQPGSAKPLLLLFRQTCLASGAKLFQLFNNVPYFPPDNHRGSHFGKDILGRGSPSTGRQGQNRPGDDGGSENERHFHGIDYTLPHLSHTLKLKMMNKDRCITVNPVTAGIQKR